MPQKAESKVILLTEGAMRLRGDYSLMIPFDIAVTASVRWPFQ